ncbi:MAG: UDP-N-acetylmuramoyl-tripeptide--D-alanyl-D-alanine ligase [Actinomycetota bacterium]|nr:UDP-N-acetylmuramoyl-tripeptide--D-alanyl-D-alanine ligase [Actinomycetota bacterium]
MIEIKLKTLIKAEPSMMVYRGSPNLSIDSVSTDTRSLKRGDIYIPLRGENFDGHIFIKDAISKGASGFFFDTMTEEIDCILKETKQDILALAVPDTLKSLQLLARLVRDELKCHVVAITGSSGKTTTKDLLTSILEAKYDVLSSKANYNNEVGLPLNILRAKRSTEIMILEMGMRGMGQISELCKIAKPTVGVITNIGRAHYALLGSERAIAEAKSELVRCVQRDGAVILNYDDKWTPTLRAMTKSKLITYGFSKGADVFGEILSISAPNHSRVRLFYQGSSAEVDMPLSGKQNAYNALAAAGVALWLGLSLDEVKEGLETSSISSMRMELIGSENGITVINDAYNANPDSMISALESLADFPTKGCKIAVLGDMAELGEIAEKSHLEVGRSVKEKGIDILIAVGDMAALIARGALEAGMDEKAVFYSKEIPDAKKIIEDELEQGDVVLFKASRIMRLERLIEAIS